MEQPKDGKTVFKQIEVEGETLMATDKDNNVFYKFGFNKELKGKNQRYKNPLSFTAIVYIADIAVCCHLRLTFPMSVNKRHLFMSQHFNKSNPIKI